MWQKAGNYFIRGLITLLPLLITLWIIQFLFNSIDGILGGMIAFVLGRPIPGLGLIVTVLIIFLVGYFATYLISAKFFQAAEWFLYHVPVVKSIYSAVKQVNDVLFMQKGSGEFRRACLVEYPRKGIWSIGFITSDSAEEIEKIVGEKMINVFIANTPTPATGFIIMVPAKEVKLLEMKIEDAFKYVISGGVLSPDSHTAEKPKA